MIKIVKASNNKEYDAIYNIYNDDINIGSILILHNSFNMIMMTINEEYRGYGYGNSSFKLLLKELEKNNILNIFVTIPVNNIPMMRIINNYPNKIINKNSKLITYEIDYK